MILHRIARNGLFLLFTSYYLLNSLFTEGSVWSQLCFVSIVLLSGLYFIKTLLQNNNKGLFYNAWTFLFLLNIIGFLFNPQFSDGLTRNMFKNVLITMLPFYPFMYFTGKKLLKPGHFVAFLLIMLPVIILQYYTNQNSFSLEYGIDMSEVVNNSAYSFVGLIPFVFLIKKKRLLSGGVMAIIILFIIQGAKRGAIIAGFLGLIMYFFYQIETADKRNRIPGILAAVVVLSAISAFAYDSITGNDFLMERLASTLEGDSSARNVVYSTLLGRWYNSNNFLNLVFGFGFAQSVNIAGGYAHNDWLELLSNFGLTGVCTYLILFLAAIKYCLRKDWMTERRIMMLTIILIWFSTSLVSMWYNSGGFMQAIILGYLTGNQSVDSEEIYGYEDTVRN
jgi:O-antigen ligase